MNDATNTALKLILFTSAVTLAGALFFQYVLGMAPCKMCHWQRWPHMALIGLSILALFGLGPRARRIALGMMAVVALAGMSVAIYHTGVEQNWWAGPASCSGASSGGSIEALRDQLSVIRVVRCDEIPWSLFGISMAGYNALISAGLVLMALTGARPPAKEEQTV